MHQFQSRPFSDLWAFIGMGIFAVLAIVGIILLSYLLFWGALIGVVIFIIVKIKQKLFQGKSKPVQKHQVYDHDKLP